MRASDCGLRWTLEAWCAEETTTVYADTTSDGRVHDLQADHYLGTSGSPELDQEIREHVADAMARHKIAQSLDAINGKRAGEAIG